MSIFSWLLIAFVIVLYLFLLLTKREIIISAKKDKRVLLLSVGCAILICWMYLFTSASVEEWIRGAVAALIVLSFLFESHGLADTHFVVNSLNKNGIPYDQVDKIILQKTPDKDETRLYFFRGKFKSPFLIFSISVEELLLFFKDRLRSDAEVEVIIEQ